MAGSLYKNMLRYFDVFVLHLQDIIGSQNFDLVLY